jgi:hypothetical protein
MPDLLLYFQKIMAERGLTYKVGFTGRLRITVLMDGKYTLDLIFKKGEIVILRKRPVNPTFSHPSVHGMLITDIQVL